MQTSSEKIDKKMKARKFRSSKLTRIEKLTRGLSTERDLNTIFTIKELKGKGRGVFLRIPILHKDSFVLEYEGDIISEAEAKQREKIYAHNNEGCFIMSFTFQGAKMAIDATRRYDSMARLMNHSREPNIRFHPPIVIDFNGGLPRIASYALRDIYKGEEIVIDYGVRDGQISWLRNREIGFTADVDSDSSDSYSEWTKTKSDMGGTAFGKDDFGARFTRLIPGGDTKTYFVGFEGIGVPQKIMKFIEDTSGRKKKLDTESLDCFSISSSGSNRRIETSSTLCWQNIFSSSSEIMGRTSDTKLPSNKAPDSINKVLEWQITSSPSQDSTMDIKIVGVHSLLDSPHVLENTNCVQGENNSDRSSSYRQHSNSAFQAQEISASSYPCASHSETNLQQFNQNDQPSSSAYSFLLPLSSSASKHIEEVNLTVDISDSDEKSESSRVSSISFKESVVPEPTSGPVPEPTSGPKLVIGSCVSLELPDVCVVSDDESEKETTVSEKPLKIMSEKSVVSESCSEDESSSSDCEIILTESPNSTDLGKSTGNLPARRPVGFSVPTAQLQVAVIKPYVSPSAKGVMPKDTYGLTESELKRMKSIFQQYLVSNKVSPNDVKQAIYSNWDFFSVLTDRGVSINQIRHIFHNFRQKPT